MNTIYKYRMSTMQEISTQLIAEFEIKAVLSLIITFVSSLLVWDSYLFVLWLVLSLFDLLFRITISVLKPNNNFPATSVITTWFLKLFVQLSIIVLTSIITAVILRLHVPFFGLIVDWILAIMICTECIIALESLQYLGVPINTDTIRWIKNIKSKLIQNIDKQTETKGNYNDGKEYDQRDRKDSE